MNIQTVYSHFETLRFAAAEELARLCSCNDSARYREHAKGLQDFFTLCLAAKGPDLFVNVYHDYEFATRRPMLAFWDRLSFIDSDIDKLIALYHPQVTIQTRIKSKGNYFYRICFRSRNDNTPWNARLGHAGNAETAVQLLLTALEECESEAEALKRVEYC